MQFILLGLAAAAGAGASPSADISPFNSWGPSRVEAGTFEPIDRTLPHRRDRRDGRGFGGVVYLDREYQGDSAFRSNSYNDWWHERPERSQPRWLTRNGGCQRMFWTGAGWSC